MNMNYSYQATMYESILAQMCLFLVLFTIFAFYHEKFLKPKLKKIFLCQKYATAHLTNLRGEPVLHNQAHLSLHADGNVISDPTAYNKM